MHSRNTKAGYCLTGTRDFTGLMQQPPIQRRRLALSIASLFLLGPTCAYADIVNIGAGGSLLLSDIFGTGSGQTTRLSDLRFNGTSSNSATLVIDQNTAGTPSNTWVFDAANSAIDKITLSSSSYGTIRINDGINLTISGANTGVVLNSYTNSSLTFDVGTGSTLRFENNIASGSAQGVINSYSDVVFKGENGNVIFNNNSSNSSNGAITTTSANVIFEGNASFTNNQATGIAGGVIRTSTRGDIIFSGTNATVILANNTARSSGGGLFSDARVELHGNADIYGNRGINDTAGAIVAQTGLTMVANGTSGIKVHDNYANSQTAGAILIGNSATITGSSLLYAKNSDIQFYNNRTQTGNGSTPNLTNAVANAINIRQPNGILYISADAGRQVLFKDPLTSLSSVGVPVNVTVGFNTTDGSNTTSGKVTFTGEDFAANTASTYSQIYANTTVHSGTLELKDNARYGALASGTSFTVNNGATVLSTAAASNVTNVIGAGTITFNHGSTITTSGSSSLQFNSSITNIGSAASDTVTFNTANTDTLTIIGLLTGSGILQKTGSGTLAASSTNQLLNQGGLNLQAGNFTANNYSQSISWLNTAAGTTFTMGNTGGDLDITQGGTINGAFNNVNTLTKTGIDTLTFNTSASMGQLALNQGRVDVGAGYTLTISNDAKMASGTVLGVHVNSTPAVQADTFDSSNATIDITGYSPVADSNTYTLVNTDNGVTNTSLQYLVAGLPLGSYVSLDNFIIGSARIDNTNSKIIAQLDLVWRNVDPQSAHGTFKIADGETFSLGADLANNTDPLTYKFGWDGQTLTKTGGGTLILTGINTYTGPTQIEQGTLIVGGSSANSNAQVTGDVNVNNGTILGGHGKIAGTVNVNSGGTLSPGTSIGTLTVANAIFNSGATFTVEVNPDGSGDRLVADSSLNPTLPGAGTVAINANANLAIQAGAGTWSSGTEYILIDTDQGVTGTFSNVSSNLVFLVPTVNYENPQQVRLVFKRNETGFGDLDGTYNQIQTGWGVESLRPGNKIYDQIVSMSRLQALNAFDNLSGEIHASAKSALFTNSRYARAAVSQHLGSLNTKEQDPHKNLWVSVWGHEGHLKADGNAERLSNNGGGFLIGSDLYSNGTTTIGVAGGYEQTRLDIRGTRASDAEIDAFHVIGYGRTTIGAIDLKGGVGYSWLDIDTERNIWVDGLSGKNQASYNGGMVQIFAEGSHTFELSDSASVTPYAGLAYQHLKTDGFTESGGSSILHGSSSKDDRLSSTVGVRGQLTIHDKINLYADAGWQHNFGSDTADSDLNFIGGYSYNIRGVEMNRDSAIIAAGATFELQDNMHLSVGYEGEFGNRSRDNALKVLWRLNF